MPNLAEIHPVVRAPNPNKQTNKQQTDRQASYIYTKDVCIVHMSASTKLHLVFFFIFRPFLPLTSIRSAGEYPKGKPSLLYCV